MITKLKTWAELRVSLPEAIQASAEATNLVRRATAHERHAERSGAAFEAAMEDGVGLAGLLAAWGLCAADSIGVGGHGGMGGGGCGTERVACFRGSGSGRKQAGDGRAWDAAIKAARYRCLSQIWEMQPGQNSPRLSPGPDGVVVKCGDATVSLDGDISAAHIRAIAGRGILLAVGIQPPALDELDPWSGEMIEPTTEWVRLLEDPSAGLKEPAPEPE